MKRSLLVVCTVVFATVWVETSGLAQVPFRQYGPDPILDRPAVSPYLNLLRRDSTGGNNYYTLVRPQIEAMNQFQRQQTQLRQLQQQVTQQGAYQAQGQALITGHQTFFGNYSHFYNMGPGGGQGVGARQSMAARRVNPATMR